MPSVSHVLVVACSAAIWSMVSSSNISKTLKDGIWQQLQIMEQSPVPNGQPSPIHTDINSRKKKIRKRKNKRNNNTNNNNNRNICQYWIKNSCKFGNKCWNKHLYYKKKLINANVLNKSIKSYKSYQSYKSNKSNMSNDSYMSNMPKMSNESGDNEPNKDIKMTPKYGTPNLSDDDDDMITPPSGTVYENETCKYDNSTKIDAEPQSSYAEPQPSYEKLDLSSNTTPQDPKNVANSQDHQQQWKTHTNRRRKRNSNSNCNIRSGVVKKTFGKRKQKLDSMDIFQNPDQYSKSQIPNQTLFNGWSQTSTTPQSNKDIDEKIQKHMDSINKNIAYYDSHKEENDRKFAVGMKALQNILNHLNNQ